VVIPKTTLKDAERPLGSYRKPGFWDRVGALLVRLFSRRGPLTKVNIKAPTDVTEKLFIESRVCSHDEYQERLKEIDLGQIELPNLNLDTGLPTQIGKYGLADRAYAKLLGRLANNEFRGVSAELRANILDFYAGATGLTGYKVSKRTLQEIEGLKRQIHEH
jgi:hypothetical protein